MFYFLRTGKKWKLVKEDCQFGQVMAFDLPEFSLSALRSLPSEADEGLYYLEVHSQGKVVGNTCSGPQESCTFQVSAPAERKLCLSGPLVRKQLTTEIAK